MIDEELDPDNPYGNREGYSIIEKLLIGIAGFSLVFAVLCFIIWGASRPYKTLVSLKVNFLICSFLESDCFNLWL